MAFAPSRDKQRAWLGRSEHCLNAGAKMAKADELAAMGVEIDS